MGGGAGAPAPLNTAGQEGAGGMASAPSSRAGRTNTEGGMGVESVVEEQK